LIFIIAPRAKEVTINKQETKIEYPDDENVLIILSSTPP